MAVKIVINDKEYTGQRANDLLVYLLADLGFIDPPTGLQWQRLKAIAIPYANDPIFCVRMLKNVASDIHYPIKYG